MNDLAKQRDKKEQRRLELAAQRRRYLEEVMAKADAKKVEAKAQAKRDAKKGKS